jgi:flagellar hook-basal body complex protein FliE
MGPVSGPICNQESARLLVAPLEIEHEAESPGEATLQSGISGFLDEVNQAQLKAQDEAVKLAMGESRNVHEALVSLETANISLQFTVAVRNKIIEAYQEIMRMQL